MTHALGASTPAAPGRGSPAGSRLVYTMAFGHRKFGEMAMGLARSLDLIGDPTPRAILTDLDDFDWNRYFQIVVRRSIPREETYWAKFTALEYTNADKVLFLDGDSLVFRRLDPIFEAFDGAHVGVQATRATSGRWYEMDIERLCRSEGIPHLPKMNGGLWYYERTEEAKRVVATAKRIGEGERDPGFQRLTRSYGANLIAEEPYMALAMARTGIGRDLPDECDFMSTGVGLIGRLRMDVRRGHCYFLCRRGHVRHVRPYVFHASRYSNFLVYWRQLARLREMEKSSLRLDRSFPRNGLTIS